MSDAATLEGHRLLASGKVREIYEVGDDRLLMVASDRISTYDVVHPNPIPGKGAVLTGLSVFWFERTGQIVPNHVISYTDGVPDEVRGRALLVEHLLGDPALSLVSRSLLGTADAHELYRRYGFGEISHGHRLMAIESVEDARRCAMTPSTTEGAT